MIWKIMIIFWARKSRLIYLGQMRPITWRQIYWILYEVLASQNLILKRFANSIVKIYLMFVSVCKKKYTILSWEASKKKMMNFNLKRTTMKYKINNKKLFKYNKKMKKKMKRKMMKIMKKTKSRMTKKIEIFL